MQTFDAFFAQMDSVFGLPIKQQHNFWVGALDYENFNYDLDQVKNPFTFDREVAADTNAQVCSLPPAITRQDEKVVLINTSTSTSEDKATDACPLWFVGPTAKLHTTQQDIVTSKGEPLQHVGTEQGPTTLLLDHDFRLLITIPKLWVKTLKSDELLDVTLAVNIESVEGTISKGPTDVVHMIYNILAWKGVRVGKVSSGFHGADKILLLQLQISSKCKEVGLGCRFLRPSSAINDKSPTSPWRSITVRCGLAVQGQEGVLCSVSEDDYKLINRDAKKQTKKRVHEEISKCVQKGGKSEKKRRNT